MPGFSYVYIPVEPHKPMEELIFPEDVGLENDQFIEKLKKHFTNASQNKADANMFKQHLEGHAGKEAMEKVTDDTMEKMLNLTTVDIFPVLLPIQTTGFHGVSIYVDDKGVSKNLPLNERASSMVINAGYPDTKFFGDAFLAKIFDDQDAWSRIDMKLSEMNSEADWIKMVKEQRKNKSTANTMSDFKNLMAGQMGGAQGMENVMGQHGMGQTGAAQMPMLTESNNNGQTDVYEWREENKEEFEITFKDDVVDKKKVKVSFTPKKLKVMYDGKELVDCELCKPVDAVDCSWSIVDKKLQVTLMKKNAEVWGKLGA